MHAAWGLALSARMRERFGLEADAIWSDDGIIMHLPDLDAEEAESLPSASELVLIEPEEVEQAVVAELGGSALFGARFRENAARALLIPRAYPGRRTPLWQQRLKAQNLLEVARRYEDFPIVLETYRECLRDVLDLPGLKELLRGLHSREISLVEVETQTASPFASSLLFDYVATYMYEGDTPTAERRAAALSLDRDLLRELLGQEELRELIDPGALERVEEDLQRRSEMTRATDRDGLHDVLRRVGDLTRAEVAASACSPGVDADGAARGAAARAARGRAARRRRAAADRGRRGGAVPRRARRRAARRPARGVPRRRARRAARARRALRAHARAVRGGGGARALRRRRGAVLRELERDGALVRGELRPGGTAARLVRRRGAAAPAPRLARGAAQGDRAGRPAPARRLPAVLAGRGPPHAGRRRHRPPARGARAAAGPGAAGRDVGARRAAAAHRRLLADVARRALRERRARVGRRRRARAQRARRALLPRGRRRDRPAAGARRGSARQRAPSRPSTS